MDLDLSDRLKQRGRELGFALVGITSAARPATLHHFQDWLRDGLQATMDYLPRREAAYAHPAGVQVGVRSIVVVAMNYGPGTQQPAAQGKIAAYAQGTADYHTVLRERLQELAAELQRLAPQARTRIAVDTAPLLERDLAQRAGLGWFGKNTMLINKWAGSYFFLAALLTDQELRSDEPHQTSHCGTCTRCLDVCPTDAFRGPYVLDAGRCISYLTIERRKDAIPEDLRSGMGEWLFGCDLCQQVCPWNRRAAAATEPELMPKVEQFPDAEDFLSISEEEFQSRLGSTPLSRPGRAALARNAAIVLGNRGDPTAGAALCRALSDESPLVRGAAAWSLGELKGRESLTVLQQQLQMEPDPEVQQELLSAIRKFAK